ncbi:MAG: YihY/virulence factor BrkB family protein, partial [Ferruginibacter sp.]
MLTRFEKIFIKNQPVWFLLQKSKRVFLPGFHGVALFDVLRYLHQQLKTIGLAERAGAISYNFVMSVPPSLLFIFTLIPHLPFIPMSSLQIQLHSLIFDMVPRREYNQQIISFVDSFFESSRVGLLSFSLIFTLFFASNAMMGLMRAFNKNYEGFQKRKNLAMRWIAIKLTILMFGLLLSYLFLLILQGKLLELIVENSRWRYVISYGRWVLMIAVVFFAIAFVYKYAPAVHKRWKLFSPGTVLATGLSLLSSIGFSIYVNNFGRYN